MYAMKLNETKLISFKSYVVKRKNATKNITCIFQLEFQITMHQFTHFIMMI